METYQMAILIIGVSVAVCNWVLAYLLYKSQLKDRLEVKTVNFKKEKTACYVPYQDEDKKFFTPELVDQPEYE